MVTPRVMVTPHGPTPAVPGSHVPPMLETVASAGSPPHPRRRVEIELQE